TSRFLPFTESRIEPPLVAVSLNLTNDARKGDHRNGASSTAAKSRRSGVRGRAGRVDVVDEDHRPRPEGRRPEGSGDVPPPLRRRQPTLARTASRPRQQRLDRQLPT